MAGTAAAAGSDAGFARAFVALAAVGTPATMALCYPLFAREAAVVFGIRDMAGDYLAGVLAALGVLGLIQLLPVPARHRTILTGLWLARVAVALGLMLFYEGFYVQLDAVGYFQNGLLLRDPWPLFEYGMGTEIVTALVSLLSGVSGSYSLFKVAFAATGLAAVYVGYRAATMALGRESEPLLWAFGLMPSILFWTSILGKEPIVSLGVALAAVGAVGLLMRRKAGYLLVFALGVAIAASIRSWLGVVFAAPMLATLVLVSRSPLWVKIGTGIAALPVFALLLSGFADRFALESTQDLVARTNELAAGFAQGGSVQELETDFGSPASMLAFLPVGIFTALFRPLPGEVMNPFGLLAGLENAAVLAMLVRGVWRRGTLPFRTEPVLVWAVLTLLAWAALYGFVSYYNLGTAFRYRQIVAPLLTALALWAAFGPPWRPPAATPGPPTGPPP